MSYNSIEFLLAAYKVRRNAFGICQKILYLFTAGLEDMDRWGQTDLAVVCL